MSEEIVVFVTTGSHEEAKKISRQLIKDRLVACVNIVPSVESIFEWEGSIAEEREVLLIMKTRAEAFDALEAAVKKLHSYDVPEIIALPIQLGSSDYLAWVKQMVKPS